MNRRTLLSNAGLALAGLGMGACAPKSTASVTPGAPPVPKRPMVVLPPVRVSMDRVIRATEQDSGKAQGFAGFLGKPEMAEMNRVEGAAEDADRGIPTAIRRDRHSARRMCQVRQRCPWR